MKGGVSVQFKFHSVSENEVRKAISNMDEKKANLTGVVANRATQDTFFYVTFLNFFET